MRYMETRKSGAMRAARRWPALLSRVPADVTDLILSLVDGARARTRCAFALRLGGEGFNERLRRAVTITAAERFAAGDGFGAALVTRTIRARSALQGDADGVRGVCVILLQEMTKYEQHSRAVAHANYSTATRAPGSWTHVASFWCVATLGAGVYEEPHLYFDCWFPTSFAWPPSGARSSLTLIGGASDATRVVLCDLLAATSQRSPASRAASAQKTPRSSSNAARFAFAPDRRTVRLERAWSRARPVASSASRTAAST